MGETTMRDLLDRANELNARPFSKESSTEVNAVILELLGLVVDKLDGPKSGRGKKKPES